MPRERAGVRVFRARGRVYECARARARAHSCAYARSAIWAGGGMNENQRRQRLRKWTTWVRHACTLPGMRACVAHMHMAAYVRARVSAQCGARALGGRQHATQTCSVAYNATRNRDQAWARLCRRRMQLVPPPCLPTGPDRPATVPRAPARCAAARLHDVCCALHAASRGHAPRAAVCPHGRSLTAAHAQHRRPCRMGALPVRHAEARRPCPRQRMHGCAARAPTRARARVVHRAARAHSEPKCSPAVDYCTCSHSIANAAASHISHRPRRGSLAHARTRARTQSHTHALTRRHARSDNRARTPRGPRQRDGRTRPPPRRAARRRGRRALPAATGRRGCTTAAAQQRTCARVRCT